MRSQWKRSEKFDTGSRHFERILKARPHIRDVIQSKLVWNSKAKALLFCPKFVYSVVSLNVGSRAVKPEPKRTEKGVTFLSLPAKNKKLPKKFKRLRRDERFIPKKTQKCECVQWAFHRRLSQTEYWFELVGRNTRSRSLKNAFRQFFNGRLL